MTLTCRVDAAATAAGFELISLPDAAAVAEQVASLLLEERLRRPQRPLGLATGATMVPVYRAMARQLAALPVAEQRRLRQEWLSFNLDEYLGLGAADAGSFAATMARQLVGPLGLAAERVHLPDGRAGDGAAAARAYGAALAAAGGIGLQLLGLGRNGHVGFNEPPCGPEVTCRPVQLCPSTRAANAADFGGRAEAVPAWAITLGLREILAAERIVLVVTGGAKAAVLERLLQGPATPELPASWLKDHPAVSVIVDRAALGF